MVFCRDGVVLCGVLTKNRKNYWIVQFNSTRSALIVLLCWYISQNPGVGGRWVSFVSFPIFQNIFFQDSHFHRVSPCLVNIKIETDLALLSTSSLRVGSVDNFLLGQLREGYK